MFDRTKIYTVQLKPQDGLHAKPEFIREGFNIYAFALTGVWALYHRLWQPLLMIVLFNVVISYMQYVHLILPTSFMFIQLGFNLLVGFHANDWLRAQLTKKGYVIADVAVANNVLRAQQRYFERSLQTVS
jgi:hypothetical protein